MFHNRALNNTTRALRLVYQQNKDLSFGELPELDNAVNIHQKSLKVLVTNF